MEHFQWIGSEKRCIRARIFGQHGDVSEEHTAGPLSHTGGDVQIICILPTYREFALASHFLPVFCVRKKVASKENHVSGGIFWFYLSEMNCVVREVDSWSQKPVQKLRL